MVLKLTLPVEIALERNISRDKKGVEDSVYVSKRHAESKCQEYAASKEFVFDTSKPLSVTLSEVKRAVWGCL